MRIKNLFYMLLALPLAFAACTDTPDEVKKEAQLTLTSADTLEFKAEGGTAEISYTLVNPVEGTELTATCEAEWVSVAAGDKVRVPLRLTLARHARLRLPLLMASCLSTLL